MLYSIAFLLFKVLLPRGQGSAEKVPEWVFERSPAEIKAALLAAKKKREQGEVLMTRAMREKTTAGTKVMYKTSTVRVRLPEGLLLEGKFMAGEPVAAIFNWVSDCLADPCMTYELVMPDRKSLVTSMGTLRSADLLPNALLIFRPDPTVGEKALTLKNEIMASIQNA